MRVQAETITDRGISPFVAASITTHLESRSGGRFFHVGPRATVDAGLALLGGSIFTFEIGLRGATTVPFDSFSGVYVQQAFGAFGGIRAQMDRTPWFGELRPVLRGGLGIHRVSDAFVPETVRVSVPASLLLTRWTAGPHMAVGVEWDLGGGAALNLSAVAHATISPLVLDVGGQLSIVSGRF